MSAEVRHVLARIRAAAIAGRGCRLRPDECRALVGALLPPSARVEPARIRFVAAGVRGERVRLTADECRAIAEVPE